MLKYKCPKCGAILKVPKSSVGENIKCEKCNAEFLAETSKNVKYTHYYILLISIIIGICTSIMYFPVFESWEGLNIAFFAGFCLVWILYVIISNPIRLIKSIYKLRLSTKRKLCLWMGTLVMDVAIGSILYDRVVHHHWEGGTYQKWTVMDAFLLMALIIITTAVIFYTLTPTDKKQKDE